MFPWWTVSLLVDSFFYVHTGTDAALINDTERSNSKLSYVTDKNEIKDKQTRNIDVKKAFIYFRILGGTCWPLDGK